METAIHVYLTANIHFKFLLVITGQGFAFKRKQKLKHDYNKFLHKERKKKNQPLSTNLYTEERYPEHLRHLYVAEAEKLKNEAWTHRLNRSKLRMRVHEQAEEEVEDADEDAAAASKRDSSDVEFSGGSDLADSVAGNQEPAEAAQKERWVDSFSEITI